MHMKPFSRLGSAWGRSSVLFLSVTFVTGLCLGSYFAFVCKPVFSPLLPEFASASVSLLGIVVAFLLPLLLSGIVVLWGVPGFLIPLCFIKAFGFGYCSCGSLLFFGDAGWLIRFLLLFSNSCMLVPMLWFWLRHIDGAKILLKRDFLICIALLALFCTLDYFVISPYLIMLMNS